MTSLINSLGAQQGIVYIPATAGAAQSVTLGASGTILTSTGTATAPTFQPSPISGFPEVIFTANGTLSLNSFNVANAATLLTLTMPSVVPAGSALWVFTMGTGLCTVQLAAGQTVLSIGGIVTPTAAPITFGAQYQLAYMYCVTANTQFAIFNTGSLID